jgi:hypothetical protein
MSMIAEKWEPVFGNDHAQTREGVTMIAETRREQ